MFFDVLNFTAVDGKRLLNGHAVCTAIDQSFSIWCDFLAGMISAKYESPGAMVGKYLPTELTFFSLTD